MEEGQTTPWPKENGQKDKQRSTIKLKIKFLLRASVSMIG
jgi:hypothetical protein